MTDYPHAPGSKGLPTSAEAAPSVSKANQMRERVTECYRTFGPMTADQCAAYLRSTPLAIRPRVSELHTMGILRDTGRKERNRLSRKFAAILELVAK